jgi:hypothetical protein
VIIYLWKVIVWDKVLGLGTMPEPPPVTKMPHPANVRS